MNENKHVCPLCDYVYLDSKGDPAQAIDPGTPFKQLPKEFKHPDCAGTLEQFETCTCAELTPNNQLSKTL